MYTPRYQSVKCKPQIQTMPNQKSLSLVYISCQDNSSLQHNQSLKKRVIHNRSLMGGKKSSEPYIVYTLIRECEVQPTSTNKAQCCICFFCSSHSHCALNCIHLDKRVWSARHKYTECPIKNKNLHCIFPAKITLVYNINNEKTVIHNQSLMEKKNIMKA